MLCIFIPKDVAGPCFALATVFSRARPRVEFIIFNTHNTETNKIRSVRVKSRRLFSLTRSILLVVVLCVLTIITRGGAPSMRLID